MSFQPPKARGLGVGLGALVVLIGLGAACLALFPSLLPSPLAFVLVCVLIVVAPAIGWLSYRCLGLLSARYHIADSALTVEWGGRREVIPLAEVDEAHLATEFAGDLRPPVLNWPGCVTGRIQHPTLGAVEFLATTDEKGRLVLVGYSGGWLALSPADPQAFLAGLAERGPARIDEAPVEAASEYPELSEWALWHDRLGLALIALGGLALLALFGYFIYIFPQLPPEIALRFNAQGQPVRFGPPIGIFTLTVIGAVAWGLNTAIGVALHRRQSERTAAYLLFGATLVVQALTWVAAINLLTAGRPA
jgi:hypothetical protein